MNNTHDLIYQSEKVYNGKLNTINNNSNLTEQQKKDIIDFCEYLKEKDLGNLRVRKYASQLNLIANLLKKDFRDITKTDIKQFLSYLNNKKNQHGNNISPYTILDYKIAIKKFIKWLNKGETPESVKWVKIKLSKKYRKLPQNILSQQEIKRMIEKAPNTKYKALISVLYESGCRIGEILGMGFNSIISDDYGMIITVFGKTGWRRLRVIQSIPYVSKWLSDHPNPQPESFIWIGNGKKGDKPLDYDHTRRKIAEIGKKAKITKPVNPHSFRHARATHLANKLTEPQMRIYFGWQSDSDMPDVYVHTSGRDVDNAILEINGIKQNNKEDSKELTPIKCSRCDFLNGATAKLCGKCNLTLDIQTAIEYKESKQELHQIIENIIEKKLKERLEKEKGASSGFLG